MRYIVHEKGTTTDMVRASIDYARRPLGPRAIGRQPPVNPEGKSTSVEKKNIPLTELLPNVMLIYDPKISKIGVAMISMARNKHPGPASFQPIVCRQGTGLGRIDAR